MERFKRTIALLLVLLLAGCRSNREPVTIYSGDYFTVTRQGHEMCITDNQTGTEYLIYQTARKTPTDGHRGRTAGHNENRSQYGNTNDQKRIQCDNYNCQSNWGSIPIPGLKGGETMTDEKRTAAEAKRAETYRRKRESEQRRREELAAQKADIERARAICREIRDKADASDADKLKAVELLHILNE